MSRAWNTRKGRSFTSWIRKSTRFAIYHRDGFDCVWCRGVFPPALDGVGLTLDHVVPRYLGGSHRPDNLVTSCLSCNAARQERDVPKSCMPKVQRLLAKPVNQEAGRLLCRIFSPERASQTCSRGRLSSACSIYAWVEPGTLVLPGVALESEPF